MKKNKLVGIILSAMMIISCFSTIAAESRDTYNITINNPNSGHTYEAYQIFSGRLEEVNGENLLSDIQWGTGVNGDELLIALKEKQEFGNCTNAAQIADILSKNKDKDNAQFIKEFAKIAGKHLEPGSGIESTYIDDNPKYVISGLKPGYYLVKDKDDSDLSNNDAYTDFILEITDNKAVDPKSSVPTVEKKVLENSDRQWKDIADYSIGEEVSFSLTGSMPSNISSYETYKYVFHDTMANGFDLIDKSVIAYVVEDNGNKIKIDSNLFEIISSEQFDDGCSFEVKFNNLKKIVKEKGQPLDKNDKIIVEYKAKLNEQAVIAGEGNTNKVSLEFSNNPNGNGTGKTPEDKVKVFTYELVVNKKDENRQSLDGANFTLYKFEDGKFKSLKSLDGSNTSVFKFTGLDSGKYKLEETKAPKGYNKIEDIVFTIESQYNEDDLTLQNLDIKDKDVIISGEGGSFSVNLNPSGSTPNISTDVINKKGAVLPDTGGIGTTIFYIAGSMIMIGVAVVFVAKKRKKTN